MNTRKGLKYKCLRFFSSEKLLLIHFVFWFLNYRVVVFHKYNLQLRDCWLSCLRSCTNICRTENLHIQHSDSAAANNQNWLLIQRGWHGLKHEWFLIVLLSHALTQTLHLISSQLHPLKPIWREGQQIWSLVVKWASGSQNSSTELQFVFTDLKVVLY